MCSSDLDYAEEYDVAGVEEDKEAIRLELKARTRDVAYDRLRMQVDRRTTLPVEIEAYAATGLLVKTLRFRDVKDFGGGIRRPATVETDSPVFKGYRSVMLYSQLRRRQLPDEAFTLNYLPRVEDLRK